jgi:type VI secretion system secreted protein Hcp
MNDFSFGVQNATSIGSATSGAGAGKIQFNEFSIRKTADVASGSFFKNCAAGAHYAVVTVALRQVGGTTGSSKPYLVYNVGTVFTTRIAWSGPGEEGPEEIITFAYGGLSIAYAAQLPDGKMEALKSVEWNQMTNTASFPGAPLLSF